MCLDHRDCRFRASLLLAVSRKYECERVYLYDAMDEGEKCRLGACCMSFDKTCNAWSNATYVDQFDLQSWTEPHQRWLIAIWSIWLTTWRMRAPFRRAMRTVSEIHGRQDCPHKVGEAYSPYLYAEWPSHNAHLNKLSMHQVFQLVHQKHFLLLQCRSLCFCEQEWRVFIELVFLHIVAAVCWEAYRDNKQAAFDTAIPSQVDWPLESYGT